MPHDSPLPRVHTLGSNEGRMQQNELMDLVIKLTDRVEVLENNLKQTKRVYGAAFIKLIKKGKTLDKTVKSNKARRRAKLVVSNDEEDDSFNQGRKIAKIDKDPDISLVQQMIHHDAQTQGRQEHDLEPNFEFTTHEEVYTAKPDISTANVLVSTAGAEVSTTIPEVSTAAESLVYIRRSAVKRVDKGKAIIKEAEPKKGKADKEFALRLQAEERGRYSEADKARLLQLKKLSFDEIKKLFETTMKRVKDFVPTESDRLVPKIEDGSSKRDAEEELNQVLGLKDLSRAETYIKKVLRDKRLEKAQNQLKNQKIKNQMNYLKNNYNS
ncbi:hypothetical protein Tco_0797160 [Tanacetum coccineum]